VAVAESNRLVTFHIAQRARSSNFLEGFGETQANGTRETQIVPALSLSWISGQLGAEPDILKIDTEGTAHLVLMGAEELIARKRPRMLIEVNGETADWTTAFLRKYSYLLFDGDTPRKKREPLAKAPWNTLAIPE
jgi:hypothetical protein